MITDFTYCGPRLAGPLAILLLLATPAAALAAPAHDGRAAAQAISVDRVSDTDTTEATIEPFEPLTVNDRGGRGCTESGLAAPGTGVVMGKTVWYSLQGDGRIVTLSTAGSGFDTALAVYQGETFVTCHDDLDADRDRPDLTSELRLRTIAGALYHVQLGGACWTTGCQAGPAALWAFGQPANDDRAGARTVQSGTQTSGDNLGATEERGEVLECALGERTAPYAKTVWYRWTPPDTGTAVIQASGSSVDTVLAVYRGDQPTPVACDDDSGEVGPSRVPVTVSAGEYLIQVGGFGRQVRGDAGGFVLSVEYAEEHDRDGDGVQRPPRGGDCNDAAAAVHPGALEIANDGLDENCDGRDLIDGDRDGASAPPDGGDCDDHDPGVRPGATEQRGNGRDENCNGVREDYLPMRARVRALYQATDGLRRFRLLELSVRAAEAGTRIELRCRGRGCSFVRRSQVIRSATRRLDLRRHFRRGRMPAPGTIEVRITRPETVGVVRRLEVKPGRHVKDRTLCLPPTARGAAAC